MSNDIDPLDPLVKTVKVEPSREETEMCIAEPEFCNVKSEYIEENPEPSDQVIYISVLNHYIYF